MGEANFDTKNTGTGKTVTATTLSLSGANAGNYVLASGASATSTANITAVQLTPHITANNKPYDGSTTATLSAQWVTGMITGETVTIVVGAQSGVGTQAVPAMARNVRHQVTAMVGTRADVLVNLPAEMSPPQSKAVGVRDLRPKE